MPILPIRAYVVLLTVGLLLSFGRGGMLPFTGNTTTLDLAMNLMAVIVAPGCALSLIRCSDLGPYVMRMAPMLALATWVGCCLLLNTEPEYWPNRTELISLALALFLPSQVTRSDLPALRLMMLWLAFLLSASAILFAPADLANLFSGGLKQRLGIEYSEANAVAYPRMLDVLVFTCFATVVTDQRWWLRLSAAGLIILPATLALATAGRGALAALLVTSALYLLAQRPRLSAGFSYLSAAVFLVLGYWTIETYLPLMRERITSGDDSGRSIIYRASLSNLSLFGTGNKYYYPHNLFLEFAENYGLIGLALLIVFLGSSFATAVRSYYCTKDPEILWVIGLMSLQLLAQQFSLNIFQNMLWAALLLPIGLKTRAGLLEYGVEDPLLPYR